MKRLLPMILVFGALTLTACKPEAAATERPPTPQQVEQLPPPLTPRSTLFESDLDDLSLFASGLIESERAALEGLEDCSTYRIDVALSQDLLHVDGQQEVDYTNREDVPLEEIYFRLYPNISGGAASVSDVLVVGTPVDPVYEKERSALRLPLPTPLQPGDEIHIKMRFSVKLPTEMSGNYGLFGSFDGVVAMQELYPVIPVYDDEGWNIEIPPSFGDLTYLDASFYLVRVTVPEHLTLIASGIEVETSIQNDLQVSTFAAGPARDFYLVAVEDYEVTSTSLGETTIYSYAPAEKIPFANTGLEIAAEALSGYSSRFGAYPYTELEIVATPMQALGMEYPNTVAISIDLYDADLEIAGLPAGILLESSLAHEVAHQWFYGAVGNDQVDEPWVDEALTQYATWTYYLDRYGKGSADGFRDSLVGRWERVGKADIPIGLPTGEYEPVEYGAIVYGRGPLFLEALAQEMGQKTFDAFMRAYFQNNKWGIGTAANFRQLAEESCGCDLSELFDAWVYPP
ncbi:MAG: M1 family metallopeptidase [Anaerolineales bacterium]|jgi:hypothetical protein